MILIILTLLNIARSQLIHSQSSCLKQCLGDEKVFTFYGDRMGGYCCDLDDTSSQCATGSGLYSSRDIFDDLLEKDPPASTTSDQDWKF